VAATFGSFGCDLNIGEIDRARLRAAALEETSTLLLAR
jgi:hypothetical protein